MGHFTRYGFLKVAWQELNMSPWAKRRVSTTANRLFGRGEHAPSERHKSDFEKAMGDSITYLDITENMFYYPTKEHAHEKSSCFIYK